MLYFAMVRLILKSKHINVVIVKLTYLLILGIIDYTFWGDGKEYNTNVYFTNECDNPNPFRNLWTARTAEKNEFLEIDLGENVFINEIFLKNSRNALWNSGWVKTTFYMTMNIIP